MNDFSKINTVVGRANKKLTLEFKKSKTHPGLVEFTMSLYEEGSDEPYMSDFTYCELDNDMINFQMASFNGDYTLGKLLGFFFLLGLDWMGEEKEIVESLRKSEDVEVSYDFLLDKTKKNVVTH